MSNAGRRFDNCCHSAGARTGQCRGAPSEREGSIDACEPLPHDANTNRFQEVAGRQRLVGHRHGWYSTRVVFSIELEREDDGRWLAEVPALPGVMCYGADRDEAVARVQALALRVIAERLEHREAPADFVNVTFQAA